MTKMNKYIDYRRAQWLVNDNNQLEQALRDAWAIFPNSIQRIVERFDGSSVMGIRIIDFGKFGVGIHCARYVEKQGVGVVPMTGAENENLSERSPGNNENFLNSDFMALVYGDHVLSISAGNGAASLRMYLHGLFRKADLHEDTTKFDLVRIANANKIEIIQAAGGVGAVELDLSIEEATARLIESTDEQNWGYRKLVDPLFRLIGDLIADEEKPSQLRYSGKGNMRLSISVPAGDVVAAKQGLDGIAEILLEDDEADDYVIRLRNGQTIKPSEIAVKKRVRLERYANSVKVEDAFEEMRGYLGELMVSGQLEA